MILKGEYLTEEQLINLENYKYLLHETNPLSVYVMHPLWRVSIKLFPKWIAPNLLTLFGFLFTVLSAILFTIYDYDFGAFNVDKPTYSPIPRWVFGVVAFNSSAAYILDAMDGRQAARTKTSGPLGEIFDHGLDSWTTILTAVCMFSMFGITKETVTALEMYYLMWIILLEFYLCHWEKYNTGTLRLPWSFEFSILTTIVLFIYTCVLGHSMWERTYVLGIHATTLFQIVVYTNTIVLSIPNVLWSIYKSYRNETGKMRTFLDCMGPLVPFTLLFAISTIWVTYSPGDILNKDPRIIFLTIGIIFSNISCRLIVSQLSDVKFEVLPLILVPFAVATLLCIFLPSVNLLFIYFIFAYALIVHLHYGICVIRQICRHLKINAFSIPRSSDFCINDDVQLT